MLLEFFQVSVWTEDRLLSYAYLSLSAMVCSCNMSVIDDRFGDFVRGIEAYQRLSCNSCGFGPESGIGRSRNTQKDYIQCRLDRRRWP